jgi:hypothetical protein
MESIPVNALFDVDEYELFNPAQYEANFANFTKSWQTRDTLFKTFGVWNYPNKDVINSLQKFIGDMKCLEIGAGSGLWSMMLRAIGVNIVATDSCGELKPNTPIFTEILKMTADDAVDYFQDANVLMSVWPRGFLYSALEKFKGEYFIFVGEIDGCTGYIDASDKDCCFEVLMEIDGYVPFLGIHDIVVIYKRKSNE